jgi:hypothetical protein
MVRKLNLYLFLQKSSEADIFSGHAELQDGQVENIMTSKKPEDSPTLITKIDKNCFCFIMSCFATN